MGKYGQTYNNRGKCVIYFQNVGASMLCAHGCFYYNFSYLSYMTVNFLLKLFIGVLMAAFYQNFSYLSDKYSCPSSNKKFICLRQQTCLVSHVSDCYASSNFCVSVKARDDEDMTNMHITIWNVIKITKKVEERSKNIPIKLEAQSNLISILCRNPGVGCTKIDVQISLMW
jgi:hypothetical protein